MILNYVKHFSIIRNSSSDPYDTDKKNIKTPVCIYVDMHKNFRCIHLIQLYKILILEVKICCL